MFKRMVTGGLVAAVAAGAMVLSGPAAEAAPARSAGLCSDAVNKGLYFLEVNGLSVPNPPTWQNVFVFLDFYAKVVLYGDGARQAAILASEIERVCG
jgi:hypothetical protein